MRESKFEKISDEALLKNVKTLKMISSLFVGALIVLLIAGIFMGIKNGFNGISIIPVALFPILLLNFYNLSEVNKEIKKRNLP